MNLHSVNSMKAQLSVFDSNKYNMIESLKKFVTDKKIPLDARFTMFLNSGLGEVLGYEWCFDAFDECEFHSYLETYEMCTPDDVLYKFSMDGDEPWEGEETSYDEEATEFKEEVLEKFVASWIKE